METNEEEQKLKGTKHLKYNVIYPSNEQEYYPMMDFFEFDDITLNELDVIQTAIDIDKKNPKKHVTTIKLISPPGLGKTVMAAHLARILGCPYNILNCVSTMTDLDLLGSYVLIGQETVWQDGPLPSIIRACNEHKMGILIINELNALRMNAQMALNPLLDKQESVVLTQRNNELVKIDEDAHLLVIASMNPDVLGVNDLQASVLDRANLAIRFSYPTPEKETELVHNLTGLKKELVTRFIDVINECRKLKTDRKITKAPSTRPVLDWINYTKGLGVELAFELAVVNKYGTSNNEREALRAIARGKDLKTILFPTTLSPPLKGRKVTYTKKVTKHSKKTTKKTKKSSRKKKLSEFTWDD